MIYGVCSIIMIYFMIVQQIFLKPTRVEILYLYYDERRDIRLNIA